MASICTSNVTSGFIDLATFDEIEKYLYGGPQATAYFVRETRRSTWFTQVPVVLSRASGSPAFNQEWAVSISRAGDYLLQTWLRLQTPAVALAGVQAGGSATATNLRWTRNFMHNIIRECCITFNDLVAARFDNYHLDFWAAFTVPAGKQNGYNNMIGNFAAMTNGVVVAPGVASNPIPSFTLNLPLPFFYSRDSGVALPTAALPYNEMRINFAFRNWSDLLIMSDNTLANEQRRPITPADLVGGEPKLGTTQVWADYAIVSNDERKRMACAPRDILIEQVQTAPRQAYTPATNPQQAFDIRFSHAIKVLFFAVRNTTWVSEWSNYMTNSPVTPNGALVVNFTPAGSADPILQTSLIYENTNRLAQMGSDFFSLVNPYYNAPVIPVDTGYHMYSYSLDFISLDPMGSTNFGKLTNVSIVPEASAAAVVGANGNGAAGSGATFNQTYEYITTCVNNNIIRVSGGKHPSVPSTVGCQSRCDMSWLGKQCNMSPTLVALAA
jgi:hypothetical protein